MTRPSAFDILTIGHSNLAAAHFDALLKDAAVTAIADVRSVPLSRRFPWFSANTLAQRLRGQGIAYLPYGEGLGGRPKDPLLYRGGIADYEAMAESTGFRDGLAYLSDDSRQYRVCLVCAEREPLDCHRCLLIGRVLAKRGALVGHILHNGRIEPHSATEDRLLGLTGKSGEPDLFAERGARLAEAYRRRSRAVAARNKA